QGGHLPPPVQTLRGQPAPAVVVTRPGDLADHVEDLGVADRAGGHGPVGPLPRPVGPCGDLAALLAQDPADRLDRMAFGAHLIDERHDHRLRGSSSPAKKGVAAFSTATSSRRRRFSAFRRLISSFSSVVVPGRVPASTSAWATQRRTDSRATPSCFATAAIASVGEAYSCWWSRTRRTARARSSGSIFFGMVLILLDSNRSGIKPGAVHLACAGVLGVVVVGACCGRCGA